MIKLTNILCKENLTGKTIVTGFHGIGQVGYLSITQLIKSIKAKRVGFIETLDIPPFIGVKTKSFVTPYEIYRKNDLIIIKFEAIPSGKSGNEILKKIVEWGKSQKIEKIFLFGGLSVTFKEKDEKTTVRYLYNDSYAKKIGIEEPYVQEGVQVVGPLAVLLYYAEINEVPSLAFLSYADPQRIDPRGAINALQNASKKMNVKLDLKELINNAKKIEEAIPQGISGEQPSTIDSENMYA
uniref:PAC2 family protein n=1 Tax=uncultured marine microorganism HF4000_APKG10H11 TaxID=455559 RepID=B3TC43_9ZZZZ|nr:hypothetical protein ALOHA_HF4000APKG10H11ctg1g12 [uncultured marine microorganism HF4000_APKG10H11]